MADIIHVAHPGIQTLQGVQHGLACLERGEDWVARGTGGHLSRELGLQRQRCSPGTVDITTTLPWPLSSPSVALKMPQHSGPWAACPSRELSSYSSNCMPIHPQGPGGVDSFQGLRLHSVSLVIFVAQETFYSSRNHKASRHLGNLGPGSQYLISQRSQTLAQVHSQ